MKKLIFTFAALLAVMATACSGDAKNKKSINESKIIVLDYENCDKSLKERFNKKIGSTLEGCELLMEAKDEEETMSIYGTLSGDGSKINDIVMHAPESSALICFFGAINADELGKLVETAK